MEEKKMPHNLILENKSRLSITQVADVDTFDENKIVLFTQGDTILVEGYDLHLQKLDVAGGELLITGEVTAITYTGRDGYQNRSKGFFKRMLK